MCVTLVVSPGCQAGVCVTLVVSPGCQAGVCHVACFCQQPALLDEYSDPFDLKTQGMTPELLGACASAPIVDDDYSVPYEVKKLMRGKRF